MTPRGRARWLRSALLLLQVPGCLSLRGPSRVTGIVGGSLSMVCRYREEFQQNNKFWCKSPCLWNTVETGGSVREVREGRVSIRDHPANLTFTVTLESLREGDAGTYGRGIYVPLSFDPTFQVEVSVIPGAPAPGPARRRPLGPQALEKLREPVTSVALTARGHSPLCWMEMTSDQ